MFFQNVRRPRLTVGGRARYKSRNFCFMFTHICAHLWLMDFLLNIERTNEHNVCALFCELAAHLTH